MSDIHSETEVPKCTRVTLIDASDRELAEIEKIKADTANIKARTSHLISQTTNNKIWLSLLADLPNTLERLIKELDKILNPRSGN